MKTHLLFCLSSLLCPVVLAQDLAGLWAEVEAAREKDQPKTAIEALSKIYEAGVAREAWDDALAALGEKALLEGRIEEGANAYGAVLKLDAARKSAPEKLKPLLDALSAEWLSRYFSENVWRFSQRSEIADADEGNDIDAWSLPRISKEVDARLAVVLENPAVFTQYLSSDFTRAFTFGQENVCGAYRPTVYDVLVWRAVGFYSRLVLGNQPDGFKASLDMPLLAEAEAFMAWAGALPRDASPSAKALRLIATVMRLHKGKGNALAFADADFNRLNTAQHLLQMAHVDNGLLSSAFDKAVDAFVAAHKGNEVSARGMAAQAMRLFSAKQYADALALAEKGMDAFPKSPGARECHNVILQVKQPSLNLQTDSAWARSKPEARPYGKIDVTCRNVPELHFRLYPKPLPLNREAFDNLAGWMKKTLAGKHAYAWDMPIQDNNYQEVSCAFDVQEELKPGAYILVASMREDFLFEHDKNILSATLVQVSDLAAETFRTSEGYQLRVVNSETGLPEKDVSVTSFVPSGKDSKTDSAVTDAEGRCTFASNNNERPMFEFKKGDDRLLTPQNEQWWHSYKQNEDDGRRVLLLTDRSIYRPGQTVRYKGIYYTAHSETDVYAIRPDAEYTIRFLDPHGKVIDSRKEHANSFGSFSGSFVIPTDRGTGRMTLQMADRYGSSVSISVEEYKRPKFEVVIDPLKGEVRLNDNVSVSGRAVTYSGLPLDQAKVKWTLTRQTFYPVWFFRTPWQGSPSLATGETQTDADGAFKIAFVAEPEPGATPEDSPRFNYTLHAEVIDTTGETRSGQQSFCLGFSSIRAALDVPKWVTADTPNDVTVMLATLNGEPVASTGKALVYALRQPERPSRDNEKRIQETQMKWEATETVATVPFATDATGKAKLPLRLPVGCYRIEVTAQDKQGNPVVDKAILTAVDPASKTYPVKIPFAFVPQQTQCAVGGTFRALWGSGYPQACGVLEIWADGKLVKRVTSAPGETQALIEFDVPENLRGGFTVRSGMVREGRRWQGTKTIAVPWDNKELELNWTHINSKLEPGKQEKWTLTVTDTHAKAAHAEVVAAMYDASLDAFSSHEWNTFWGFRYERGLGRSSFTIAHTSLFSAIGYRSPTLWHMEYPDWVGTLLPAAYSHFPRRKGFATGERLLMSAAPATKAAPDAMEEAMGFGVGEPLGDARFEDVFAEAAPPPVMRKNLDETAFFIPDLETDEQGNISITFTAPEALTGWRVMAFAHDAALRAGAAEARAVTQRKLMVIPNLPRFLREGDSIAIPVKVVNTGDTPQKGTATLSLADGRTGRPAEGILGGTAGQAFDLQPGASCTVSWTLDVPDGRAGLLQYAILAKAPDCGDGEEGFLPVLSRRVQVTESMPFSVRGGQEKALQFKRLLDSANDKTLRHLSLQAELTPNATWNAILALPYLMEYPHECAEQVFHRYYANALARQVVADNPAIADVFRRWKAAGGKALESPLTKNPHLKTLALEETPWLLAADQETAQRRDIAALLDPGRMAHEQETALRKLKAMRNGSGLWPWFPGGHDNATISMLIMAGMGRLRHIGVKGLDNDLIADAIVSVDNWRIRTGTRPETDGDGKPQPLTPDDAFYLYGRSFFLKDAPLSDAVKAHVNALMTLAQTGWTHLPRLPRAQLAIALHRLGDPATARDILRAIRENAAVTEEQGLCWRDNAPAWRWHELPLESQAAMIEAFLEVTDDQASADACALWLLQQKQAQRWPTTTATAQAIHALLLCKNTTLAPSADATLTLGGAEAKPPAGEAGSGHFTVHYAPADIRPELGNVTVKNPGPALALGALHWQYLQDPASLAPSADDTPLRIKRQLFKREKRGAQSILRPLDDTLRQGDTLVTRIEVRVDRDMDFVHLKDTRAASLEPDDVLSSYRWQGSVGYFQSTRDTATHFFFDRLPRGTHVFEYTSHVFQTGACNGGFAEIQCMYAPEFNAHSASETVKSN